MSVGGAVDEEVLEFGKDIHFEIKTDVKFKYRNFESSSFLGLGIFKDDDSNEDLKQKGWKTHKGKFEMTCTFSLNKKTKEEIRAEKEDEEYEEAIGETEKLNESISGVEIELNESRVVRE